MPLMTEIETRAKYYATAREKLAALVSDLNASLEALKREAMPELKRAISRAMENHDSLQAVIEASPELFVKPKSVVFHGIKLGYQKGRGGIVFDDPQRVADLIRRHMPELADRLIKVTETPVKNALTQLTASELKKIGCSIIDTGEEVLIKPVDSTVDRMVSAFLDSAIKESE